MTSPLFIRTPGNYFRAHNATIVGDVTIGELASFWFNAVVRGDVAAVTIGRRTNVQDCAVVHCDSGVPNHIGDDVVIGHGAIVHGARVGDRCVIGMGATLLSQTSLGNDVFVAAGAVVPPGLVVPDGMMVMGVPGKIVRPVKDKEHEYMRWLVPHYVELAEQYVRNEIRMMDEG
ncbi:MAG TPA: gamma carbonic anhydrase family protein [Tepidisphaeraceae bacterium]|jgi:carbonic anhydrase/acetyltransferase-like protein (isoleucine patch superfamily)